MKQQSIIEKMQEMGFTAYESKAYVTLLKHNPATGYEISAKSEVPRSAIYDVLKRLESVGLVNVVHAKPRRYIPLPPERLLTMLEDQFVKNLNSLRDGLEELEAESEYSDLWHIQGYENMINKTRQLIREADKEIFTSIWTTELNQLKEDFNAAAERGVHIVTFSFTRVPIKVGTIYSYDLEETKLEEIWSRKIVLITDRNEVLMGEADQNQPKSAVWTKNSAIVTIAINHIVLDITLFSQRYNVNIDDTVNRMMNGSGGDLNTLLLEKEARDSEPVFIEP